MTERIECVGGPNNGEFVKFKAKAIGFVGRSELEKKGLGTHFVTTHIYRYDVTQSKYIYQGVEQ